MAISKNDTLENLIEEINSQNKSSIEILYDNTKTFLDELIKQINEVLTKFNPEKEEENLLNQ